MTLVLRIDNLPPMPRNRSHMLTISGKRPMLIKTQLCREFEKDLENRLKIYSLEMEKFKTSFDPKSHYLKAEYTIHTPMEELFTKDGRVSSRSVDLDAHKCFQDTIFRCLGLDDKLVRDVRYSSPVSQNGNWNYDIAVTIVPIDSLKF